MDNMDVRLRSKRDDDEGDGDDDDGDDDEQADRVLPHKEHDDDHHDDVVSSSSASDPPRDNGEERQRPPESEAMVEHTTPGGDAFQQQRGGNVRAHSPVEILSQPSPLSQRAGNLSPYQGGDLSLQSRPVEVSSQRQHEQESAARGSKEQEQEQGKRAPQTVQQSGQSGEQGGQSPAPQASHFTALLRKAAVGADSRVGRSKYEWGRPSAPHISRPRRAYRSKARSRLAGGPNDVPSAIPDGPRGPAGISKPGTQTTPKSPAESFGPQQSSHPVRTSEVSTTRGCS